MYDHLIELVREVAARAREHPGLANLQAGSPEYERLRLSQVADMPGAAPGPADAGKELAIVAGFAPDERYEVRTSPRSSRGRGSVGATVGHPLIARARVYGPEAAVTEMLEFLRRNEVEQQEIIAVWGFHPESAISLEPGVELVPMSQLPRSSFRDQALQLPPYDVELSPIMGITAKPRAAIVRRFIHGPVLAKVGTRDRSPALDWTERLQDMTLPLTAALRRPVFPVASWFQSEETTPLVGGHTGAGGQGVLRAFLVEHQPEPLDAERCARLTHQFVNAETGLKRGLTIAFNRLRLAHTRTWYDERAIDLGVALEAALFGDKESFRGEITYRFKVRGTLLLGGDADTRRRTWKLLGDVYSLRSRVAHGGPSPHDNEQEEEAINDGIALAFDLCERLLSLGRRPDFDALARGEISKP